MKPKAEFTTSVWIAFNSVVRCSGNRFGRIVGIALDPDACQLTHLVVREKGLIGIDRMVPIYLVGETHPKHVDLVCSRADLVQLETVNVSYGTASEYPDPLRKYDDMPMWSYCEASRPPLGMSAYESVPYPIIILRMGARVIATNGLAGRVTGLAVAADSWRITHIRIHQHKPWGHKVCAVSLDEISRLYEDAVHLQLTKNDLKQQSVIYSN